MDTSECKAKQDIYDDAQNYVKSLCLVPRGNRYNVALKYCQKHGMNLYYPDSTAAYNGVLGFTRRRYANSKKRGFIFVGGSNNGLCSTINNFAGTHQLSLINCSDSLPSKKASGWFFCEYQNKSK